MTYQKKGGENLAQYDGSLKFDTNIDSNGFNSGIKGLTTNFGKNLKNIASNVSNLNNRLNVLNGVLKLVTSTIATAFVTKGIKDCIDTAEEYQNALTGLKSITDGQGKSFSQAQSFINSYTSDGLIPATQAITAYKNLSLRGYDTSQIEQVMVALKDSATYSRQSSYSLGEAVQSAAEGLKNENSILVDNAGVTKNVAKMWEDYAKSIGKSTNNLTQQEKIQAEVNGILEETKFQTGDAETYMNSYSGMMARLNASFTTLKQTLGSAFMQIFQAILPVIQSVINALVQLASIFASLVNSIFGKTVTSNNKVAKSSEVATEAIKEQGNSAEKAGKQAKGALLDFDKLTVLDDNNSSGSGGTSGGSTGSAPEISVEGTGTSLVNELNNAFEGMDAYTIGYTISTKINEALTNIDWATIQGSSANIAYNIAMFLNGAIEGLNWSLLGDTIAGALNTVLIFVYTWLTTFNFTQFGTALATGLNSIIYSVDWNLLGQTLGAYLQSSFSLLYGFVTTFDWYSLGISLSQSIESFFNEIDWYKCGQAVGNGLKGILNTLSTLLEEVDWNKIGTDIAAFLEGLDWVTILANVGSLIEDAIGAAFDIAGGILGIDPAVLQTLAIGFGAIAAALTIYNTVTAITAAVTGAMSASFFPVIAVIALVVAAIATIVWAITELKENWDIIWEAIKTKFFEIKDAVASKVTEMVEGFKTKFEELKNKISEIIEKIKSTISEWIENLRTKFEDLKNNIVNAFENIKTNVGNKINEIKNTIVNVINNIKNGVWDALNNIKNTWSNIFNGVKDTTTNIFNGIWNVIKNIINSILGGIEKMANGVIKGINTVTGAMNKLKFDIPDWIPGLGGKTFGFNIPKISTVSIPRLATGAVIPPRQEFMAVLGDQKYGKNLEAPESLIRQIVREESGGKTITIITPIQLDKKQIAEAVNEVNFDEEITSPDLNGGGSFAY